MTPPLDLADLRSLADGIRRGEHQGDSSTYYSAMIVLSRGVLALLDRIAGLERVIAINLPHPNGPKDTTPGDPDAWNDAMWALGKMREERDSLRQQLALQESRTVALDIELNATKATLAQVDEQLAANQREMGECHAAAKAVVDYAIDVAGMPPRTMIGVDAPVRAMRSLHEQWKTAFYDLENERNAREYGLNQQLAVARKALDEQIAMSDEQEKALQASQAECERWKEEARRTCQNADYWREQSDAWRERSLRSEHAESDRDSALRQAAELRDRLDDICEFCQESCKHRAIGGKAGV